jgi:tetratricopeptide (TPR) repeat protein
LFRPVAIAVLLVATLSASPQEQAWLEQARTALGRGDFNAARTAASRVLTQNAASAEAEVILGLADTAEAQIRSAEKHFAKAVSLQPSNYRAHTYLGSTYLRQRRLNEAQRAFLRVLQLSPGNAVAQYNLGLIAVLQGKPAAALPYFSAVHQSNPADAAALIALIECQLDLKQGRAARDSAQKLDRLLPADSPELLQVGAALATHGEYSTALPLLRRFAAANPASFDAGYNLGLALLHTGNLEEAEEVIKRLLREAPKAESFNLLGAVQEKRGQQKEAVRAFAEAARLGPNNEDFRIDYGSSLVTAGLLDEATTAFSRSVAELPESLRLRLGLGSVLYLSGKYEEAAQTMLECIRRAPRFAPAYDLLGKIFESAPERQEEIVAAFQTYLQGGAQDAAAHCHYGIMLYSRAEGEGTDRFIAAKEHLRRALKLNPRLAQAHVQLGIISQAESNWTDAVASYQRAVALDPSYATARYRLGSAYQKLGNRAKAQIELDAFRALKQKEKEHEKESVMRSVSPAR